MVNIQLRTSKSPMSKSFEGFGLVIGSNFSHYLIRFVLSGSKLDDDYGKCEVDRLSDMEHSSLDLPKN